MHVVNSECCASQPHVATDKITDKKQLECQLYWPSKGLAAPHPLSIPWQTGIACTYVQELITCLFRLPLGCVQDEPFLPTHVCTVQQGADALLDVSHVIMSINHFSGWTLALHLPASDINVLTSHSITGWHSSGGDKHRHVGTESPRG